MLRRVALVRTDVLEELSASFIRVTRISELWRTLGVTSNRVTASVVPGSQILVTIMKEALNSSETSVLTKAILRNIPEDAILHSHRSDDLKSYIRNFVRKIPLSSQYSFLWLSALLGRAEGIF
jgi:hypothetical protein